MNGSTLETAKIAILHETMSCHIAFQSEKKWQVPLVAAMPDNVTAPPHLRGVFIHCGPSAHNFTSEYDPANTVTLAVYTVYI